MQMQCSRQIGQNPELQEGTAERKRTLVKERMKKNYNNEDEIPRFPERNNHIIPHTYNPSR